MTDQHQQIDVEHCRQVDGGWCGAGIHKAEFRDGPDRYGVCHIRYADGSLGICNVSSLRNLTPPRRKVRWAALRLWCPRLADLDRGDPAPVTLYPEGHRDFSYAHEDALRILIDLDRGEQVGGEGEAVEVLREVEWAGARETEEGERVYDTCPYCRGGRPAHMKTYNNRGHRPGCRLAKAIGKGDSE